MCYNYSPALAVFVWKHWQEVEESAIGTSANDNELPGRPLLSAMEHVISTCYQASLLQEEARTVTFRVIVGGPDCFPAKQGPPGGLHRLVFTEVLPFTAHELRRLSPAARFQQSLIGVQFQGDTWQVWGIIHSGPRWLTCQHGGRGSGPELPPYMVISVPGPGRVEVARGSKTVGQLSDGKVFGTSMNVFESQWLQDFFALIRTERMCLHLAARNKAGSSGSKETPALMPGFDWGCDCCCPPRNVPIV